MKMKFLSKNRCNVKHRKKHPPHIWWEHLIKHCPVNRLVVVVERICNSIPFDEQSCFDICRLFYTVLTNNYMAPFWGTSHLIYIYIYICIFWRFCIGCFFFRVNWRQDCVIKYIGISFLFSCPSQIHINQLRILFAGYKYA